MIVYLTGSLDPLVGKSLIVTQFLGFLEIGLRRKLVELVQTQSASQNIEIGIVLFVFLHGTQVGGGFAESVGIDVALRPIEIIGRKHPFLAVDDVGINLGNLK